MPEMEKIKSIVTKKPHAGSLLLHCNTCGKNTHNTDRHGRLGGARKGAGRKPGGMNLANVERNRIRQALVDRIHLNANTLVTAVLNKALGESYLMHKFTVGSGSTRRTEVEIVTDVNTIMDFLQETLDTRDDEYYYITTRPVDVAAAKELFDRGFGKPKQSMEIEVADKEDVTPAGPDMVAEFMAMAKGQTKQ